MRSTTRNIPRRFAIPCLLACALGAPSAAHAQLTAQPYVTGVSLPVGFVADPTASGRQFVVEQTGRIRVIVNGLLLNDFLDLTSVVSPRGTGAERGLLGMVLAPDYAVSGRFFVVFTRYGPVLEDRGDIVFARFKRSADNPLVADPSSRFDLRWGAPDGPAYIEHTFPLSHNAGSMAFGSDGYLYIGLGDGGGDGDPNGVAQNPMELRGKILRIDVNVPDDNPQGYRVPPDNPFVDGQPITALPEIWAFGLRNPWRITVDDPARGGTGALLIADVGQDRWEEVSYEPAGQGGRNYGWATVEGTNALVGYGPHTPAFLPLTQPTFEYYHSAGASLVEGNSITGGYVYRGAGLGPAMRGRYFFADFALRRIWSAKVTPQGGTAAFSAIIEHTDTMTPGPLSTFGVDANGELYLVRYGGPNLGVIFRVCGVSTTPILTSFSAAGGTGLIHVTTPAGCKWSVSDLPPGIALVSNAEMTGPGLVQFRVAPNYGNRDVAFKIGGQAVTVSQRSSAPVTGDVNGDGAADLVWQHADGRLAAWFMNGRTLLQGLPFGPGVQSDPAWRIVASGDFDGDATLDVVFQHQTTGRIVAWRMSGTSLLGGADIAEVAETAWKIRGAGDMNRDGWLDLIWQHEGDGRVSVWLMQGTRLRSGRALAMPVVPDQTWRIAAVADMNGDRSPDLVWQNQATGVLATWLMNGLDYVDGLLITPSRVSDTNWKIAAAGDFNGDGKADLIWQHQLSGLLAAWLMNGYHAMDSVLLIPDTVADTGWKIVGPK